MRFEPKSTRDFNRINPDLAPPCGFIAAAVIRFELNRSALPGNRCSNDAISLGCRVGAMVVAFNHKHNLSEGPVSRSRRSDFH
jgi:hypothetical protein